MVDITVRGAGVLGLSIAWACVLRGARVQVVDPFGPAAGSSGGLVGALAPHVPENWNPKKAFQLESLLMAEGFWSEVAEAGGVDPGFRRTGRTQPVADATALKLARARGAFAETLWQGQASWSVLPQPEDGWTPPSPSGWIIRDTLSAHLHPRRACAALVAALRAEGVAIAAEGSDRGRVLWATGVAGLEALKAENARPVGCGIKGQAALFALDARGKPQLFTDALHVIPHADGTVAIGSTSERDFASGNTTDTQLDALIERARHLVPALKDAPVIDRWAGVRPRSRSRAPMLGAWPARPGHYIANGGFKIGFGMAPRIAEVMAELLLEDRNGIPEGFEVTASF